jgi:hypothetical protein
LEEVLMAYQTTYGVTRGVAQEYHFSVGCHLPPPSSFVRAFVDADSRTGLVPLSILVAEW